MSGGYLDPCTYHQEISKKWDIGANNVNKSEAQMGTVSETDAENYH